MPHIEDKIQLHCNHCLGPRWHKTLHKVQQTHSQEYGEDEDFFEEVCNYRLAECHGCESISLHTEWWCSGQAEHLIEQWPPKVSRRQPKWMTELFLAENIYNPYKREFLNEIYASLKNNSLRLAVLGIRALLEQIMIESVKDQGSFVKNLNKFESEGYISKIQKEAIDPVIEAGHASMHRGFKATEQEVEAIMDVVENLIESIYIGKQKAARLKIPARPQKNQ